MHAPRGRRDVKEMAKFAYDSTDRLGEMRMRGREGV